MLADSTKEISTSWASFRTENTFGVFICYEAIYPGEVRRFAADGAQLLLNIPTTDGSVALAAAEQHLRMGPCARRGKTAAGSCARRTTVSNRFQSIPTAASFARSRPMCAPPSIFLTTFEPGETIYNPLWRLVRLALRPRFRYSSGANFSKGKVTSVPERAVYQKKRMDSRRSSVSLRTSQTAHCVGPELSLTAPDSHTFKVSLSK